MPVRAKFNVWGIEKINSSRYKCDENGIELRDDNGDLIREEIEGAQIQLMPVTDGSAENKQFFSLTPGGSIQLATVNPEAAAQFEVGRSYYVDFTPAD